MADVFFSDTVNFGTTVGLRANFVSPRRRPARRSVDRTPKADFVLLLVVGCVSLAMGALAAAFIPL
jgi:hypothetical protein